MKKVTILQGQIKLKVKVNRKLSRLKSNKQVMIKGDLRKVKLI